MKASREALRHWMFAVRSRVHTMRLTLQAFCDLRLVWLLPLVAVLFLISTILAVIGAAGPLAPFVYPLI